MRVTLRNIRSRNRLRVPYINELFELLRKRMFLWQHGKEVTDWANSVKIFFILAIGRSGTKFLSCLLNKSPHATVVHEPVLRDFSAYLKAVHNPKKALNYIQLYRKIDIYLRVQGSTEIYGEVNSALRRHVNALQKGFPKAVVIHLIRDGRDVVRSMISRKTMTVADVNTRGIRPSPTDPWFDKWEFMDRFSRLCWYWQNENAFLRRYTDKTVHFEGILSDYEYFQERVLEPCSLSISHEVWSENILKPRNITSCYRMPMWADWTAQQKKSFSEICGEEMRKNGYCF